VGLNYSPEVTYRCTNDCRQEGCPGHTMRLSFCRSSDTVAVEIDGKPEYYFGDNTFAAMLECAAKTAKSKPSPSQEERQ
jgi:hypothetical protein